MEICKDESIPGQMKIKSGRRQKRLDFFQRCNTAYRIAKTSEIFVSLCLLVKFYINFVLVKMFNRRIVRSRFNPTTLLSGMF